MNQQLLQGSLIIKPSCAKLTHDTETFGRMDPYCTVTIGARKQQTRTHNSGGKNPVWQDTLSFDISGESMAEFNVFDKDNMSADDWIGSISIPLHEICAKGTYSNWYNLNRKGKSSGTLMVQFEWHGTGGSKKIFLG